jgi:hypothetical protein
MGTASVTLGANIQSLTYNSQSNSVTSLNGNLTIDGVSLPWTSGTVQNQANQNPGTLSGLGQIASGLSGCATGTQ